MNKLIDDLEKVKNSVLAITAIIYGIGLVNWSIYAFTNNLGLVSVFDTQYFVAGLIPFVLFALVIAMFKIRTLLYNIDKKLRRIARKFGKQWDTYYINLKKRFLFSLLTSCLIGWVFLVVFYKIYRTDLLFSIFPFCILISIILIIWFKTKLLYPLRNLQFIQKRFLVLAFKYMFSPFLVYLKIQLAFGILVFTLFYAIFIYPLIPQALGGAKPRKCVFECKKELITNKSISEIFDNCDTAICNSKEVYVFFYNGEKMLFKEDKDGYNVYEIKRDDITLITWID